MAGTSTLMALKATSTSSTLSLKQTTDRKRDLLVLLHSYLLSNNYLTTSASLKAEAGATLGRYENADNIDLLVVLKEYEEYYEMRFERKPKLTRRIYSEDDDDATFARGSGSKDSGVVKLSAARKKNDMDILKKKELRDKANVKNGIPISGVLATVNSKLGIVGGGGNGGVMVRSATSPRLSVSAPDNDAFAIGGNKITLDHKPQNNYMSFSNNDENSNSPPPLTQKLLKPLPSFNGDMDLRQLAETITRDILQHSPSVKFSDIIELDDCKRLLKEAVVMPLKYPQLFKGLLSPWCGILLYGPPGTGKTMLAKAVASECETTFFNISASSIVSKYRGDSEKLIRVLFELARYHAPSTVFMDEIDSIMGHRGGDDNSSGGGGEHEGSRRMKTELLIQMDGLASITSSVFVLAASNLPWDLDPALLRRLEKRVLVPLPGPNARLSMLEMHLSTQTLPEAGLDFRRCAEDTEGYSGADIKLLCKEAAMRPVRRLLTKLDLLESSENERNANVKNKLNSRSGNSSVTQGQVSKEKVDELIMENPITQEDLDMSAKSTNKSSGGKFHEKYVKWAKEFGSV